MKNICNSAFVTSEVENDMLLNKKYIPLFGGGIAILNKDDKKATLNTPKGDFTLSYFRETILLVDEKDSCGIYPKGANSANSLEEWLEVFYPQVFWGYVPSSAPSWCRKSVAEYLCDKYPNFSTREKALVKKCLAKGILKWQDADIIW